MTLEQIIQQGTHLRVGSLPVSEWIERKRQMPSNNVGCVDGFSMSVIAGDGTYCSPRPGMSAAGDYAGPYDAVEVGYPTARPEPWDVWEPYCENADDPTDTVYAFVPVDIVRALIAAHGGEA